MKKPISLLTLNLLVTFSMQALQIETAFANVNPSGCVEFKNNRTGRSMIGHIQITLSKSGESYGNVVTLIQDLNGGNADRFVGRALNSQVSQDTDSITITDVFMTGVGDSFKLSLIMTNDYLQIGSERSQMKYPRVQCPK